VKRVKTKSLLSWQRSKEIEHAVPDGIIARLTRECGGNVHGRHVVDVTSGSFEKETWGPILHVSLHVLAEHTGTVVGHDARCQDLL
jgi:hypothetical protein